MARLFFAGFESEPVELSEGENTLGRDPGNSIQVSDTSVSSFHCRIVVEGTEVMLHDLESTNGTFVDDVPVTQAVVGSGSVIRIGQVGMRLDVPPEVRVPEVDFKPKAAPAHLPDGSPCCFYHSDEKALFRCTICSKTFCNNCIHRIGLKGRTPLTLCPECSNRCEVIVEDIKEVKKAFSLKKVFAKTVRMLFR
ncbi:MAG: FHA domain-containing protein [Verrucomicrobia bacterium]|nr:FHA domain-containing protein [Verrucomicrobiota bacterium]